MVLSKSIIAERNHSSLRVLGATKEDYGLTSESSTQSSPFSFLSVAHGNKLRQIAGRVDWRLAKVVLGVLLLLPALPYMIRWQLSGHSPYPFLLNPNAVESW